MQWKRELDSWASSESEGQSTLPVVLFANKSDLLTNAKESFVLGARMEQLCRKVRWKYCGYARGGSRHGSRPLTTPRPPSTSTALRRGLSRVRVAVSMLTRGSWS